MPQSYATSLRRSANFAGSMRCGFSLLCGGICAGCSFWCLYRFRHPVNLNASFDGVDIEAIRASAIFYELTAITLRMKGPFGYIGGKNRIADHIIGIFPKHQTYVEVFSGGAQVLFHKQPSEVEVLNDIDGEVVTFFRVCQSHYEELLRYMKFLLPSRGWFELLRTQDPKALTDVQRAARFLYLQKNAYAGTVRTPGFRYAVEKGPIFNPKSLPEIIERTHDRLARVQIECASYEDILRRYDRPTTLFYLDPPYWGRRLYRFNFSTADFEELERRLEKVRARFVLSLNDVPEVRKLFSKFRLSEIELSYTAQRDSKKRFAELLITNYESSKVQQ